MTVDDLHTMDEAARILHVSRRTLEREQKAGYLRTVKIRGRRLVADAELRTYLANQRKRGA